MAGPKPTSERPERVSERAQERCEYCDGDGRIYVLDQGRANDAGISDPSVPCRECRGTGISAARLLDTAIEGMREALSIPDNDFADDAEAGLTYVTPRDPRTVLHEVRNKLLATLNQLDPKGDRIQ